MMLITGNCNNLLIGCSYHRIIIDIYNRLSGYQIPLSVETLLRLYQIRYIHQEITNLNDLAHVTSEITCLQNSATKRLLVCRISAKKICLLLQNSVFAVSQNYRQVLRVCSTLYIYHVELLRLYIDGSAQNQSPCRPIVQTSQTTRTREWE